MLEALINHSQDLQQLQARDFALEVCDGWLIVHHIPYLNSLKQIKDGTLLMKLCISGDHTIKPHDHTAYWIGEWPCDLSGTQLKGLVHSPNKSNLCHGYVSDFYLSCHAESTEFPPDGNYPDYATKMEYYFDIIAAPALSLDSEAWKRINKPIITKTIDSPLQYMDTNASRAGITALNNKYKGLRIAIIGLGGTGSYLLDFLAKTPVAEIHLFDSDVINTHNAFRAPGAMSEKELSDALSKVGHYAEVYSNMHKGIVPHDVIITSENVSLLDNMDYVFFSLDKVKPKNMIARHLLAKGIPFIDSGLGIDLQQDGKLSGIIQVASGTTKHYEHLTRAFGNEDADEDMYASDIQIAELNALAATLSIIRWKKMIGFYADITHEYFSVFGLNDNIIENEAETV